MAMITYTCPHCGAKFEADSSKEPVKCPYCDSAVDLKIPAEIPVIQGSAGVSSKKPTNKPWGSFDSAKETWAKTQRQIRNNANSKGKKHLGLWILGWIFCFPIPLTILLIRSKKLQPKVKYSLVAALWVVVLAIGLVRNGKKNDAAREVSSVPAVKQETTKSEAEVKDPEIITANMIDVTGKKPDEAIALLNEAGFMNVTTDADKNWDPDRIFVDAQNKTPGSSVNVEDKVFLSCKKICKLYIDVSSDSNLFFDTYDMDIYLDEDSVGTVSNGKNITKLMEVVEGTHVIKAVNSGNDNKNASKSFEVDSDVTFSADIAHGGSIQFNNVNIVADISGSSLEVIDVKGMVLSDALSKLKEIGFSNVQYEPNGDIWDRSNWTVISQSVEAGTETDKNTNIVLDCKKTTSYVDEQLIGLTANQAIVKAGELGFTYSFLNGATFADITEEIDGYSEEEQTLWVVKDASGATSSDKILSLSVVYTGNVIVPDLVGSNLQFAIDELQGSQFSDIGSVASDNSSIINKNNWTVIAQSSDPGSEHPANENITLTCKKTTVYIAEQFNGLTADKAIEKAADMGFSLSFADYISKADATDSTKALSKDEQALWTVTDSTSVAGDGKQLKLTIQYSGKAVVPSTVGTNLQDAENSLIQAQFSNVKSVASDSTAIFDESNWIVIAQNIEAGTECAANEGIVLTCMKTVDYAGEQLTGLNAKEAIVKARELGFSLNFSNAITTEDITGNILAIPEDEQTLWLVQKASSGGTGRNSIRLTVVYSGNVNMPNLVGFSLDDAIGSLHNIQLSSVTYEATDGSPIYGQSEWAVVSQNIDPGTEVAANEEIKLICERKANNNVEAGNSSSAGKKSLYYTTNDSETAKQGNSGVYAYRQKSRGTYDIYLIVDFDDRAVYDFTEGNGSNECMRYEMIQGDLNGTLIIQYNASDSPWKEGLCFKYKEQPVTLIRDVGEGWQIEFAATDLDSALRIKNQKTILTD